MTTTANASFKQYQIAWHGEPRTLTIPAANIIAELGMTDFPPLADLWGAIVQAMENPP